MKKLSVFIALCIIFSSCTKEGVQFAKQVREDIAIKQLPATKGYKVPVQMDLRSQRNEIGFGLKKGTNITTSGEYQVGDGYIQMGETIFKTGGDVDFTLTQWDGMDANEARNLLGSAVIHIKFNKGVDTEEAITGTGTWTFGKIEGTMTRYVSEGAGVLTYKYDRDIYNGDPEFRYPIETYTLKGLMKK